MGLRINKKLNLALHANICRTSSVFIHYLAKFTVSTKLFLLAFIKQLDLIGVMYLKEVIFLGLLPTLRFLIHYLSDWLNAFLKSW